MNNHDTISLLRQGPTEWNRWAETMLAQRAALENSNSWNANAEKWLDDATADFSNCIISNDLSFNGLIFPGEAVFRSTVFENADLRRTRFEGLAQFTDSVFPESALFRWTRFKLGAVFSRASFNKDVTFRNATFLDHTEFLGAKFLDTVEFSRAKFTNSIDFSRALFSGLAEFEETNFPERVSFFAIRSELSFSLANAKFEGVPNFVAATFREAPRLDNIHIPITAPRNNSIENIAYYRKLRLLAASVNDHERERDFFVGELKSRRHVVDSIFGARYWIGLCYGALSDYGRSLVRPVLFWFLSILFFTMLYIATMNSLHIQAGSDTTSHFLNFYNMHCLSGDGTPLVKAFIMSIKNALFIIHWEKSEFLSASYACLYSITNAQRAILNIPDIVIVISLLQSILSATLIFLFAFALRNHFRIS